MKKSEMVGMWVSTDGFIRLALMADGRYDEARGPRKSAYTGRWRVDGGEVRFEDDSGFVAVGRVDGDVLTAGPDTFRRERVA